MDAGEVGTGEDPKGPNPSLDMKLIKIAKFEIKDFDVLSLAGVLTDLLLSFKSAA